MAKQIKDWKLFWHINNNSLIKIAIIAFHTETKSMAHIVFIATFIADLIFHVMLMINIITMIQSINSIAKRIIVEQYYKTINMIHMTSYRLFYYKLPSMNFTEMSLCVSLLGIFAYYTTLKGSMLINFLKMIILTYHIASYETAAHMFWEKYGDYPGSLTNAEEYFGGQNGSGESTLIGEEDTKRFWSHLSMSNIITLRLKNDIAISITGHYMFIIANNDDRSGIWIAFSDTISDDLTEYLIDANIAQEMYWTILKSYDKNKIKFEKQDTKASLMIKIFDNT